MHAKSDEEYNLRRIEAYIYTQVHKLSHETILFGYPMQIHLIQFQRNFYDLVPSSHAPQCTFHSLVACYLNSKCLWDSPNYNKPKWNKAHIFGITITTIDIKLWAFLATVGWTHGGQLMATRAFLCCDFKSSFHAKHCLRGERILQVARQHLVYSLCPHRYVVEVSVHSDLGPI